MALQGLITLEAGIALALGANIGTCATAGLAAIGKPREAVRVVVAHVVKISRKPLTDAQAQDISSLLSVAKNDADAARDVIAMKGTVQTQVEHAEQHQAQRLVADVPNRIAAYSVETEVIEKLKRIYYFAKHMAKTVEVDTVVPAQQAV